MTTEFEGKVAFIRGACADIIAVDLCDQIDSVGYRMATPEDLDETVNLVEKTGRRILAEQVDVRDFETLKAVVAKGVSGLSRMDFVLANAGILPIVGEQAHGISAFDDAVDVMLNGLYYTIEAALPALLQHGDGGAIVITSSAAGLTGMHARLSMKNHGLSGYIAAKHGVVGLMRVYANMLAEKNIRVNTVNPTGLASPMTVNEEVEQLFAGQPEYRVALGNLMPVSLIEPNDVSDAMVYLCGDSGRCITGITLPVDAGFAVK